MDCFVCLLKLFSRLLRSHMRTRPVGGAGRPTTIARPGLGVGLNKVACRRQTQVAAESVCMLCSCVAFLSACFATRYSNGFCPPEVICKDTGEKKGSSEGEMLLDACELHRRQDLRILSPLIQQKLHSNCVQLCSPAGHLLQLALFLLLLSPLLLLPSLHG